MKASGLQITPVQQRKESEMQLEGHLSTTGTTFCSITMSRLFKIMMSVGCSAQFFLLLTCFFLLWQAVLILIILSSTRMLWSPFHGHLHFNVAP